MKELYCDLVALYTKLHNTHIQTVKMAECATLHPTLWEHYETLQGMIDRLWEDVLIKWLDAEIPSPLQCLKSSTISWETMYSDSEEIVSDIYKDYEYLKNDIKTKAINEKDLLIQNILIELRDTATKLCADMSREMCDKDDSKKETKKESKEIEMPKIKWLGIKA